MKLFDKKNVVELEDGSKHIIKSPVVNDILNSNFDDATKLQILKSVEDKYDEYFALRGENAGNMTKAEYFGLFGMLLVPTTFGILTSAFNIEALYSFLGSLLITGGALLSGYKYAEHKKYSFSKPKNTIIYNNMRDFKVAQEKFKNIKSENVNNLDELASKFCY